MTAKDQTFRFDQRRRLAQDARRLGVRQTARRWNCARNTVRRWLRRYQAEGLAALKERSHAPKTCPHRLSADLETRILDLRKRTGYGARRLKIEFHLPTGAGAIHRVIRAAGLTRKPKTKRQKKNDLRAVKAALRAFQTVQMDVKYLCDIPRYLPQMRRQRLPQFQYTLRDVRTGLLFVSFADRLSKSHACLCAARFLSHLKAHGVQPGRVTIQTDNGAEFDGQLTGQSDRGFRHVVEELLGAHHRFIPPGCSNANADVETSHNLIECELFDREDFHGRRNFLGKLCTYQDHFNRTRKNSYQGWRTPLERLRLAAPDLDPRLVLLPPIDLDRLLPRAPKRFHLSTSDDILLNLAGGQHQPGHPEIFISSNRRRGKKQGKP